MIKVDIKILGALVKPFGKGSFQYECKDGISLRQLLIELKYNERHLTHVVAAVNGEKRDHNFVLNDDDAVELFTVVGGG